MPRVAKASEKSKIDQRPKRYYNVFPWQCEHHARHSEIRAYVEASGNWEAVAEIHQTTGLSAEPMAAFICNLINDNQHNKNLLLEAMHALELVLDEGGLTYSSEQGADSVITRIKKRIT